jgi:signal transduction histidine kinase
MRLGIKGKQVLGVTSIVGAVVVALSLMHLSRLASVSLDESRARAELLSHAIFQRAFELVADGGDPFKGVRGDPGLRSILESSLYSKNVTFAAIVDARGVAVVHADPSLEGQTLPAGDDIGTLLARSAFSRLVAIYSGQGRDLVLKQPLLLGDTAIGSIRIGVSTLLMRQDIDVSLRPEIATAFAALGVAVFVAMLLAQRLLRPIHVIRSGLTRLGRGEFGVRLDLNPDDEFGELGSSFNAVSEQLLADRSQIAGNVADRESAQYASQLQSTIRYARKLAALGRLSAGVAHEVKNPLNAMMIHLELLRQHTKGVEALRHVDVIANEIRRLDEVMQSFLKFTRPEDLKLQPISVSALFDEIAPLVRPEADRANVELIVDCREAPDLNGDPAMLRQAFLNLALNACQAMTGGGTLRIHAEAARARRVAIAFSDTGVGIRPEHLGRIFDLYFTTREKGSGIGLSMVYRTVQMHDGEVEVQSTPGAGTTFRVLLPQA